MLSVAGAPAPPPVELTYRRRVAIQDQQVAGAELRLRHGCTDVAAALTTDSEYQDPFVVQLGFA